MRDTIYDDDVDRQSEWLHFHTCLWCGNRWACDERDHFDEYPGVRDGQGFDMQCEDCAEKHPPLECPECGEDPECE